jgi:8-oxo-dGTP pyrophosphatase MutT (NUDIX family)
MLPEFTVGFFRDLLKKAQIPGPPTNGTYDETAVFLLTFCKKRDSYLLAVLKADNQGYPWRNQVALPGGHIDKSDRSPLDAAYRELKEEVGILRNQVSYIGSLGHFQTIAHKDIEAFLGVWNGNEESLKYDPREISKILKIPIADLIQIHITSSFYRRDPNITELIYPVQDLIIWGVTARIFHYFCELILKNIDPS